MPKLRTIISGGQTGVDQAALQAARDCGLTIGGWCPPGRECEAGLIPPEFALKETPNDRSPEAPDVPHSQRTEWNARDSDGTLVIGAASLCEARAGDFGTEWTIACAKRYKRPLLVCGVGDPEAKKKIEQWVGANSVSTLNVAGPSELTSPGIGERSYTLLKRIFAAL